MEKKILNNLTSDDNLAIKVSNLTKIYHLYDKPQDRLKEALNPFKKSYHHDFYAMENVSFEIKKSETVGIIGKNGAGKSTLLKMITGVLTPSSGSIEVNGKIASLLELGTGFNPDMTGHENIYLYGTLMGRSREEIDSTVNDILEFADIGEFIYQPVKTYSSGMAARLGFSVAINIEPEILIVDEVLSVGDMTFQAKSMLKMKSLIENQNTTVLFVSHDIHAVKSICKKVIYIHNGKLVNYDNSTTVIEKYIEDMTLQNQNIEKKQKKTIDNITNKHMRDDLFMDNMRFKKNALFQRIQNGKANFINVVLLNNDGEECIEFDYGEHVILRMVIQVNEDIDQLGYGYFIRDNNGNNLVSSTSMIENSSIQNSKVGDKYIMDWQFELKLGHGSYSILSALAIPIDLALDQLEICDYVPLSVTFLMKRRSYCPLYAKVYWRNDVVVSQVL